MDSKHNANQQRAETNILQCYQAHKRDNTRHKYSGLPVEFVFDSLQALGKRRRLICNQPRHDAESHQTTSYPMLNVSHSTTANHNPHYQLNSARNFPLSSLKTPWLMISVWAVRFAEPDNCSEACAQQRVLHTCVYIERVRPDIITHCFSH